MRTMNKEIVKFKQLVSRINDDYKNVGAPYDLVCYVHEHGKLPVVNFAAGGIVHAVAALMMQLVTVSLSGLGF